MTETGEEASWGVIRELVEFDFDEELGEEAGDCFTRDQKPALIVGGNVHIEGDASSSDLARGKQGYDPDTDRGDFTMIVLGDVTVTGALDVVQNAQLFVTGSVKARTIRGCSSNLIAKGTIEAEELICFEQSEEGGVLFGGEIRTPLAVLLDLQLELDLKTEIDGETAGDVIAEEKRALARAAAALTREPEAPDSLRLYNHISELIVAGKALDFARAYRMELSGKGADVAVSVAKPGTAIPLCEPQPGATLVGVTVDGSRIYAAGGIGSNLALVSDDGGRVFRELRVSVGTGLRKFLVDGETLYVCGERGMLARSTDAGKTFELVDTGATVCIQTIIRGDGALWATGGFGASRSPDEGKTWSKVNVEGAVSRPQDTDLGVLLPSDKGYLYVARKAEIRKTPLDAGGAIWSACTTNRGTVIAVGANGAIHRSTDGGKTFEKVTSGVPTSLENVACTPNGLVVVVGEKGTILRSVDDGASFQRVKQAYTDGWFFGAAAFGDQVLVAGAERLLLTVG